MLLLTLQTIKLQTWSYVLGIFDNALTIGSFYSQLATIHEYNEWQCPISSALQVTLQPDKLP